MSSDPKYFGLSSLLTGISNHLRFDLLQKFSRHNELAQDIAFKNCLSVWSLQGTISDRVSLQVAYDFTARGISLLFPAEQHR